MFKGNVIILSIASLGILLLSGCEDVNESKTDSPPDPTPPDPSAVQSARYIQGVMVIRWDINNDQDFLSYSIERSETNDTVGFEQLSIITNQEINYYIDSNIEKDRRYYFKVATTDVAGNDTSSNIKIGSSYAKISFYVHSTDGIYTVDIDGGYVDTILTLASHSGYEWSPDYSKIAFDAGSLVRIGDYSYNINDWGHIDSPFPSFSAHSFVWSPYSDRIFFYQSDGSVWMNLDGTGRVDIQPDEGYQYIRSHICKLNDNIACIRYKSNSDRKLRTMSSDGTVIFDLQTNLSIQDNPVWSPDGSKLVFRARVNNVNAKNNIYLISADGSGLTNVTNNSTAHLEIPWEGTDKNIWSQYGKYIYYYREDNKNIIIRNMDSGSLFDLSSRYENAKYPAWISDTRFAFKSGYDPNEKLILLDGDGQNPETIFLFGGDLTNSSDFEYMPN